LVNSDPILELAHVVELQKWLWANDIQKTEINKEPITFTYKTLGSALWALHRAFSTFAPNKILQVDACDKQELFVTTLKCIVQQGGDSDTNASVAGAFLGAYIGFSGLPPEWLQSLDLCSWLIERISEACEHLGIMEDAVETDPDSDLSTH